MAGFYNAPKDGEKFSTIAFMDWNQINSTIDFEEFRFCSNDEYYYVFGVCNSVTDVIKSGDKDWRMPKGEKLMLKIARKPVKRKKDTPEVHYEVEKLMVMQLEKIDPTKAYAGQITLQQNGFVSMIVSGLDPAGKPVPQEQVDAFSSGFFSVTEKEIELIQDADMIIPKGWSGFGGKAGQTELEKLGDRLTFIRNQIAAAGYDYQIKSVLDLDSSVIHGNYPKQDDIATTITLIIHHSRSLMFAAQ
jgi:hypothetical protein